jgi:metal-sulfur cluster biosynthetic enzyme
VEGNTIKVLYTPTIPHCSMAQMIGLMLKVKLLRSVSGRYKTDVRVSPGTHVNELDINKQLKDKERVAAAL